MLDKFLLTRRRSFYLGLSILTSMIAGKQGRAITTSKEQDQILDNREKYMSMSGSLKEYATDRGLIYGAASRYSALSSNLEFADIFAKECGILVPESELKWKALRPTTDSFDFTKSDWMAQFAGDRNILFRGHTLVWHNALPPWFAEKVNQQNAEQYLVEHIKTVVGHYAGQIHSWDVVNEAINPSDGREDGLRKAPWLDLLGSDYIDLAFRIAAQADPQALLVYNETGLDYDTSRDEAKRKALLKLLYRLKMNKTPIHAVGIQAHLWGRRRDSFNPKKLRDFLRHIASLDLKIMITELDVSDQGLPKDIDERDRIVAQTYQDYLSVVLDEPAVIEVLTWGLSDRYTWLSKKRPRSDGTPVRPLPLDRDLNRKPAWQAIARAFEQAPDRSTFS